MMRSFILVLFLIFFFGDANASDPLMAAMQNGMSTINNLVTPNAIDFGFKLFYYFIAFGFVYYGLQYWASGGGFAFIFGDFLTFIIKACIPYLFLIHNKEVTDFVNSFFFGFAGLMMDSGTTVSSLSDFPLTDILMKPLRIITNTDAEFSQATAGYQFQFPYFVPLFSYYGAYLLVMVLALFYAFAILLMVAQFILGIVLLTIALAMAPLMTVFVNGWIFSGLFQSWLSFTMSSGFILIVGAILIKIAESLILGFSGATDLALVLYDAKAKTVNLQWSNIVSLWLFSIVIFALSRQVQTLAGQLGGGAVPNIGSVGDNRGKGPSPSPSGGGRGGGRGGGGSSAMSNFGGASLRGSLTAGKATGQTAAKLARSIQQNGVSGAASRGLSTARESFKNMGQKVNDWSKPR
jgi:hypothetical protein